MSAQYRTMHKHVNNFEEYGKTYYVSEIEGEEVYIFSR
jgi:hypothetical protein